MSKADKMFEELGYQKKSRTFCECSYWKLWGWYEDTEHLKGKVKKDGKLSILFIDFQNLIGNHVSITLEECKARFNGDTLETSTFGEPKEIPRLGLNIEPELIKAIYKKCEELDF